MTTSPQPSPSESETSYEAAQEAAGAIASRYAPPPRVALVLGSGLGDLADRIADRTAMPYDEIPHLPRATVAGHTGQLVLGTLGGVPVAAMQGRLHLYEGYTPEQVVFPLRVLRLLGAEVAIITAAAGGLHPALAAGSLMLVGDHIALPVLSGLNPLRGPNDARFGTRFPSLTDAYDPRLRALAREAAAARGMTLHEGVYAMVAGPSYETPAELRMLRTLGADAVGMSTVPEAIAARHMGMRVLAVCAITNAALAQAEAGVGPRHDDVLATAEAAGAALGAIIEDVFTRL